jgi:hypothetical protein
MPSTDPKPELTAKASMAQPVSQPAVYANGLNTGFFPNSIESKDFGVGLSGKKNVYMNMCIIVNGYRNTDV